MRPQANPSRPAPARVHRALVAVALLLAGGGAALAAPAPEVTAALGNVQAGQLDAAITALNAPVARTQTTDWDIWTAFGGDVGLTDVWNVFGAADTARLALFDRATLYAIGGRFRTRAATLQDLERAFGWADASKLAPAMSANEAAQLVDLTTTAAPPPAGAAPRAEITHLLTTLAPAAIADLGMSGLFRLAQLPRVDAANLYANLNAGNGHELAHLFADFTGLTGAEVRDLDAALQVIDVANRAYLVTIAGQPNAGAALRRALDHFGMVDLAHVIDRARVANLGAATLLDFLTACADERFRTIVEIDAFFTAGAGGVGLAAFGDADFRLAFEAAAAMVHDGPKNNHAVTAIRVPAAAPAGVIPGGSRQVPDVHGVLQTVTVTDADVVATADRCTFRYFSLRVAGGHPQAGGNVVYPAGVRSAQLRNIGRAALHADALRALVATLDPAGVAAGATTVRIGARRYDVHVALDAAGNGAITTFCPVAGQPDTTDLDGRQARAAMALRRSAP